MHANVSFEEHTSVFSTAEGPHHPITSRSKIDLSQYCDVNTGIPFANIAPFNPNRKSHARKRPSGHVKRPKNAWIWFRSDYVYLQGMRGMCINKNQTDLTKEASDMWQLMDDVQKAPWNTLARQDKEKHAIENPTYSFKPQRMAGGGPMGGLRESPVIAAASISMGTRSSSRRNRSFEDDDEWSARPLAHAGRRTIQTRRMTASSAANSDTMSMSSMSLSSQSSWSSAAPSSPYSQSPISGPSSWSGSVSPSGSSIWESGVDMVDMHLYTPSTHSLAESSPPPQYTQNHHHHHHHHTQPQSSSQQDAPIELEGWQATPAPSPSSAVVQPYPGREANLVDFRRTSSCVGISRMSRFGPEQANVNAIAHGHGHADVPIIAAPRPGHLAQPSSLISFNGPEDGVQPLGLAPPAYNNGFSLAYTGAGCGFAAEEPSYEISPTYNEEWLVSPVDTSSHMQAQGGMYQHQHQQFYETQDQFQGQLQLQSPTSAISAASTSSMSSSSYSTLSNALGPSSIQNIHDHDHAFVTGLVPTSSIDSIDLLDSPSAPVAALPMPMSFEMSNLGSMEMPMSGSFEMALPMSMGLAPGLEDWMWDDWMQVPSMGDAQMIMIEGVHAVSSSSPSSLYGALGETSHSLGAALVV